MVYFVSVGVPESGPNNFRIKRLNNYTLLIISRVTLRGAHADYLLLCSQFISVSHVADAKMLCIGIGNSLLYVQWQVLDLRGHNIPEPGVVPVHNSVNSCWLGAYLAIAEEAVETLCVSTTHAADQTVRESVARIKDCLATRVSMFEEPGA